MVPEERLIGRRVYLDTNIFIYQLIGHEPFRRPLAALASMMESGRIAAVTSEITLAELLVKPFRDENQAEADLCRSLLRPTPHFKIIPVDRDVLIEAARVRAQSNLKLPDAIHTAAANSSACDLFLTNDARFQNAPGPETFLLSEMTS